MKNSEKTKPTQKTTSAPDDSWLKSIVQAPTLVFEAPLAHLPQHARIIRLAEIGEENHQAYRLALANVYATLDPEQALRLIYLIEGSDTGVSLYIGLASDDAQANIHDAMKSLRGALEGQLPGINFAEDGGSDPQQRQQLFARICQAQHQGLMLGAPTIKENDDPNSSNFQGLDRLVGAMQSGARSDSQNDGNWHITVVSQPLARAQIRQQLDMAYSLSSELQTLVRTSVQVGNNSSRQKGYSTGSSSTVGSNEGSSTNWGKNESGAEGKSWGTNESSGSNSSSSSNSTGSNKGGSQTVTVGTNTGGGTNKGTSNSETKNENYNLSDTTGDSFGATHELSNKRAQHLVDFLDKQLIERLKKGLTKGLFHSAVYFSADNRSNYQRLKQTLRATYQGSESTLAPLEVFDLPAHAHGQQLRLPHLQHDLTRPQDLLFHSLHQAPLGHQRNLGSLLTAEELAVVASLPQNELQGVRRRKTVSFAVALPQVADQNTLDIGHIIDRGRAYPKNRVLLSRQDLNKHTFITGVTGAGKTNTCLNLLLEADMPFLVIEPAKTEYRELADRMGGQIDFFRPNGDDHQSLRINPLALVRKGQRIVSHAGFLKNAFAAVFPLEASMPAMLEQAILGAYEEQGWDLEENTFLPGGDPFDPATRAWPTLSDMIRQLDRIIPTFGLGKEFEEKYRGSLVSRLRSLTDGTLGRVLDVPQSIDFDALLGRRAVIELEELQGGEEKAFVMALILGSVNEAMRQRFAADPTFRQLTLIEEAHRLLARPEPGNLAAALAVEAFANMLAEIRKYGTGLIIADQIPAKLVPDVIKNTHTKIVHRLFAEDDRRAMGEAMMMDDDQRGFLPNLGTGEAIVFCGGWHGPAHTKIRNDRAQTDNHRPLDTEACQIAQLWRERQRYYPKLAALPIWGDDAATFARFVRHTRQAQQQFLYIAPLLESDLRANRALAFIQNWQKTWQPALQAQHASYTAWRGDASRADWPEELLAAAWFAMLLDANPRLKVEVKNEKWKPFNHAPATTSRATSAWLQILPSAQDIPAIRGLCNSAAQTQTRVLKQHLESLKSLKSI